MPKNGSNKNEGVNAFEYGRCPKCGRAYTEAHSLTSGNDLKTPTHYICVCTKLRQIPYWVEA